MFRSKNVPSSMGEQKRVLLCPKTRCMEWVAQRTREMLYPPCVLTIATSPSFVHFAYILGHGFAYSASSPCVSVKVVFPGNLRSRDAITVMKTMTSSLRTKEASENMDIAGEAHITRINGETWRDN